MCIPSAPKPDPSIAAAQEAQRAAEAARARELKQQTYERAKSRSGGYGVRSLISSSGSGFGRNFFD